jgi:hypothetical protein
VRLMLKVVIQNDGDFVDVILLYSVILTYYVYTYKRIQGS